MMCDMKTSNNRSNKLIIQNLYIEILKLYIKQIIFVNTLTLFEKSCSCQISFKTFVKISFDRKFWRLNSRIQWVEFKCATSLQFYQAFVPKFCMNCEYIVERIWAYFYHTGQVDWYSSWFPFTFSSQWFWLYCLTLVGSHDIHRMKWDIFIWYF